jgi:hypothetical protein
MEIFDKNMNPTYFSTKGMKSYFFKNLETLNKEVLKTVQGSPLSYKNRYYISFKNIPERSK